MRIQGPTRFPCSRHRAVLWPSTMRDVLDPTLDVVFKILLAHPDNTDVLVALLSAVLRPEVPIKTVTVKNPEIPKENVDDRGVILDLLVVLDDGRSVDVEMQVESHPGVRRRALLYWARTYSANIQRGESYASIKPTVLVWFLNYCAFESIPYHSRWWVVEPTTGTVFSKALELHTVELTKLGGLTAEYAENEKSLVNWGRFMTAKTDDERKRAAEGDPMVAKAKQVLEDLSEDPETQELAYRRRLALDGYRLELGAAREEGVAIGRQEGLQKRRVAFIRQLAIKYGGPVPSYVRARVEQAGDEHLDQWNERILSAETLERLFADSA